LVLGLGRETMNDGVELGGRRSREKGGDLGNIQAEDYLDAKEEKIHGCNLATNYVTLFLVMANRYD
jgi:hypothetical protein